MRITLWREFSSNHSARFTVVGVFESADKAQVAADRINEMMRRIVAWFHQPGNERALGEWEHGTPEVSPPELEIAEQLGIPWSDVALDWVWFDEAGNSPVRVLDNIVFIDGTDSWLGSHPADYLIEKLGGRALVEGSIDFDSLREITTTDGEVYLDLTCTAPDEPTAKAIEAEYNAYVRAAEREGRISFNTPWKEYAQNEGFPRLSSFDGSLHRAGTRLSFQKGHFFHIADGFPAMLAYLKARGCADIYYSFTEARYSDDEDDESLDELAE